MKDEYWTLSVSSQGWYRDRGSKFLAFAYPIDTVEALDEHLTKLKSEHPKARHFCYAYVVGPLNEKYRANDDGEPSGSAGLPILNVIKGSDLKNAAICVIRYFGGTKLGIPGLINAYKSAAQDAVNNNTIVKKYITDTISIQHAPEDMGRLYAILKRIGIEEIANRYDGSHQLIIEAPRNSSNLIIKSILAEYHGYSIGDIDDDFNSDKIIIQKIES